MANAKVAASVVALHDLMQPFRETQVGGAAEAKFRVERIRAAASGLARKRILAELHAAQEEHNNQLLELRTKLAGLELPLAFRAVHRDFLDAIDEMIAAHADRLAARIARSKPALDRAATRERAGADRWLAASQQLKSLGEAVSFGERLRRFFETAKRR